jgi:E3 ubiquitin-protein ligase HERC2
LAVGLSNYADGLDDFSQKLSVDDARILVDLLKLAVANRAGLRAKEILSCLLMALSKTNSLVCSHETGLHFYKIVYCCYIFK